MLLLLNLHFGQQDFKQILKNFHLDPKMMSSTQYIRFCIKKVENFVKQIFTNVFSSFKE